MANIFNKWKKQKLSRQKFEGSVYDQITNKKTATTQMMILAEYFDKEEVDYDKLIKVIFGRIERDPFEYFKQKLKMKIHFILIKRNYGIYFRGTGGNTPTMKMMTTKEEFENLLEALTTREERIQVEKANVKDIINDMSKYRENIRRTFESLKARD